MNIRTRLSPDETRSRIMEVAEEHFRRVGYAKTAVADIAEALGMSPANVYRFFDSKSAIKDAICYRLLEQEHAMIEEIIASPEPAAVRLERIILAINTYNRCQFVKEKRLHDMVEVAMAENWEAVQAHCDKIKGYYADGDRRGYRQRRIRQARSGRRPPRAFFCFAPVSATRR